MSDGVPHFFEVNRFLSSTSGLVGATVYFYLEGTATLSPAYADEALTIPLSNPFTIPYGGIVPSIFLDPTITYRRKIVFSDGSEHDVPRIFANNYVLVEDLKSAAGSTMVGFNNGLPSAVTRTLQDRLKEQISLKDFGAVGDGVVDDTAAVQAWADQASSTVCLYAPPGVYKLTSTITFPAEQSVSIRGAGRAMVTFLYAGAATNVDILVLGDGSTTLKGWHVSGFRVDSTTTMTAGVGLHAKMMRAGSDFFELGFGYLNISPKLFNGIWFDNVNVCRYINFEACVQNEGFNVSGVVGTQEGSDILLEQGTSTNCNIGYRISGGMGGVYYGSVLAFGCGINYKQDTDLIVNNNREIMYSAFCISDQCYIHGIHINETFDVIGRNTTINAFIGSAGILGSGGHDIYIERYRNSRVTIASGQIFNANGHGIALDDDTTLIAISPATQITNNSGYGIYASVPTDRVFIGGYIDSSNLLGKFNGNLREFKLNSSMSVTATTGSGFTGTAYSNTWQQGTRIQLGLHIDISANGTGAGNIQCTSLPWQVKEDTVFVGFAKVSKKAVIGFMAANTTTVDIYFYDGTYPGATGEELRLTGTAEVY